MKNMSKETFLRLPLLSLLTLLLAAARPIQAGPNDAEPGAGRLPSAREANPGLGPSNRLNEPITIPEVVWEAPSNTLAQIDFDLPLTEVVVRLRSQLSNEFDVVLPYQSGSQFDWAVQEIKLQLRNVTITEVFNAMNLMWAAAETPLRWQLMMNGKRPTALLRILEVPKAPAPPPEITAMPGPEQPMVFFVGDLLGDPKDGGMSMDQLVKTVVEVSNMGIGGEHVFGHNDAQLIIVKGTSGDIGFVKNTLEALRQKVRLEAQRKGNSAPAAKRYTRTPSDRLEAPPSISTPAVPEPGAPKTP